MMICACTTLQDLLEQEKFSWVKQDLLPLFGLLDFIEEKSNGYFCLPLSKENISENLRRISGKPLPVIERELEEFEKNFSEYIEIKNETFTYYTGTGNNHKDHPPSNNKCPAASTIYYVLKPELRELSKNDVLNSFEFDPQEIYGEIISRVRTIEDLIYLGLLKNIVYKCKWQDYYQLDLDKDCYLREVLEAAGVDEELIKFTLWYDSPFKLDLEKVKKFLPDNTKYSAIFSSHKFNTSSCQLMNNISIEESIAQYLYQMLESHPMVKILKEAYSKVKQEISKNDERVPLFEYRDYRYKFMHEFLTKMKANKIYKFEIEINHESGKAMDYLKEKGIINIKDDEILLSSGKGFYDLYSRLEANEEERINKNKRELLIKWLRSGIKLSKSEHQPSIPKINRSKVVLPQAETFSKGEPAAKPKGLRIHLGRSENGRSINWEPDGGAGTSKLISGNILITGGSGSGKTETLKSFLYDLNRKGYICLALALHPDLQIDGFDIKKITAKSDIGINPLDFDSLDEEGGGLPVQVFNVVERLKISYPTLGDIQEANLREILEEAYKRRGITEDKKTWTRVCPNFEDVEKILDEKISETGNPELHRLKNKLSKVFKFKIFAKSNLFNITELFQKSTILDLSKLPEDFLFLVADTILRKIYRNLKLREPVIFDARGKDRFRIFIAIDEAKILVPSKKDDKKSIINIYGTEARKFGVGFIVSSQLTTHFGDDVLGNMATKIALKPLKYEIAQDNAKELSIDSKRLMDIKNPGEGFVRFSNEETKKVWIKPYETRKGECKSEVFDTDVSHL